MKWAKKALLVVFLLVLLPPLLPGNLLPWTVVDTGFDPDLNGFRFVNATNQTGWSFGVCLGISLAALDYWHKGIPIPEHSDLALLDGQPPTDPLGYYLAFRHFTGLLSAFGKVRGGSFLSPNVGEQNQEQYEKLRQLLLETGNPQPLILSSGRGGHAVVAYKLVDIGKKHLIYVYDPNDLYGTRKSRYIELEPNDKNQLKVTYESVGKCFSGIITLPYSPFGPDFNW